MNSFVRFVLNVNIGTKRKPLLSTRNGNCTMIVQLIIQEVQASWKLQVLSTYLNGQLKQKLRYTAYLGDGDSKSFKDIVESNIYPGHEVERHECIGHVQERVGYRLRTYKSDYKSTLLSDHKKLSGAGRLINNVTNTLQNYYGMVIRSNVENLYQMKKCISFYTFFLRYETSQRIILISTTGLRWRDYTQTFNI